MLDGLSDGKLISLYNAKGNENAMRTLVDRHHDRIYSRFLSEVKNTADADDLEQLLWFRVHSHLENYQDEGKFAHYVSRIASNLLNDYWRHKHRKASVIVEFRGQPENTEQDTLDQATNAFVDHTPNEEDKLITDELIQHLVTELIPKLPVEQRTAWLLRHESEYWEPGQRLDWQHLANLTGVDQATVWHRFESARGKLMRSAHETDSQCEKLTEEEVLVFIVWSQSQRLRKEDEFTWDYFAELLGVPTNTMKTRYRTAQKTLSEGLKARMSQ